MPSEAISWNKKDFIDGVHLVVWDTLEDLAKAIDYYKTHPLERIRIAYAGYELVKQKHTWDFRIVELNDILDKYTRKDDNMNRNVYKLLGKSRKKHFY